MKNKWMLLIGIFTLIIILVLSFKNVANKKIQSVTYNTDSSHTLKVIASFYPLYYFASEIGGDKADVNNITPSGTEPHDYEPTTKDIARIETSNMLILNGGVESWGSKIRESLKGSSVTIVTAGDGLLTQQLDEEGTTSLDPHIWLSPQFAKKEVNKIANGFISVDPSNSSYYQNNEKKLIEKLDRLDSEFKYGLSNCVQKDIVTAHKAFGYLTSTYGLNQVSISGLSPEAQPSAQQMTDVIKFAKSHKIKYIFFERLVSQKLSDTIANEIGARTLVLDPLEGLSDDDFKQGKNYFSIQRDNLKNLQEALQCAQ